MMMVVMVVVMMMTVMVVVMVMVMMQTANTESNRGNSDDLQEAACRSERVSCGFTCSRCFWWVLDTI